MEKAHHHHDHETGHHHGGPLGEQSELYFSLLCGLFLATGFGLSFVDTVPGWTSLVFYMGAYAFGGFHTLKEAVQTIAKGGFEIDFLMLVAAAGAAVLGEWAEGRSCSSSSASGTPWNTLPWAGRSSRSLRWPALLLLSQL